MPLGAGVATSSPGATFSETCSDLSGTPDIGGLNASVHKNLVGGNKVATDAEKAEFARMQGRNDQIVMSLLELRGNPATPANVGAALETMNSHYVEEFGRELKLVKEGAVSGKYEHVTLARALGEAWPGDVPRSTLLTRAFRAKHTDESHRARLRVEIGRLRKMLRTFADVSATERGFALVPRRARKVVVLARPVEEEHAAVLAFLADGESWSSSALSLALGASQRTVQRALEELAAAGKVQSFGRARARRWITRPVPGFTTTLLLPGPLPSD